MARNRVKNGTLLLRTQEEISEFFVDPGSLIKTILFKPGKGEPIIAARNIHYNQQAKLLVVTDASGKQHHFPITDVFQIRLA